MNDIEVIPSVHALENIWTRSQTLEVFISAESRLVADVPPWKKRKNTTCNFTSQRINFLMFLNFLDPDEMRFF